MQFGAAGSSSGAANAVSFFIATPRNNCNSRRNVELKKVTSKYILKSTLTPKSARKQFEELKASVQTSVSSPPELGSTSSSLPASLTSQVCNSLLRECVKRSSGRIEKFMYLVAS
jgi:hypothetical protein